METKPQPHKVKVAAKAVFIGKFVVIETYVF
jgi:hypothetical protein